MKYFVAKLFALLCCFAASPTHVNSDVIRAMERRVTVLGDQITPIQNHLEKTVSANQKLSEFEAEFLKSAQLVQVQQAGLQALKQGGKEILEAREA